MKRFMRAPVLVLLAAVWLAITPTADAGPIYLVDTLGVATPFTSFSVFGAGGPSVTATQSPGPQFTLLDNMVLTGIGAFLNNCVIFLGNPPCPNGFLTSSKSVLRSEGSLIRLRFSRHLCSRMTISHFGSLRVGSLQTGTGARHLLRLVHLSAGER
jgi:hypothetical protein